MSIVDQYNELLTYLTRLAPTFGTPIASSGYLYTGRLNAAYKQYNMGLITPAEIQHIIDSITKQLEQMSFRIQVTPVNINTPEDQFLVDTPHFVGYSTNPSFKDLDPMHSRVTSVAAETIVFDSVDQAEDFAHVLRDKNKAHKYDVVEA